MDKDMDLDTVWEKMIEMSKWIADQETCGHKQRVRYGDTGLLRLKWCKDHGLRFFYGCPFCDYAFESGPQRSDWACSHCPGRLVDKEFSCVADAYDFNKRPKEFYAKLRELNKRRKVKK